jgi:hypothetical protein
MLTVEIIQFLCSLRCPLANNPQLNCQLNYTAIFSQPSLQNSTDNWLTPWLAAISQQLPSLLFTG